MKEAFGNQQEYRDRLAYELQSEPDFFARREKLLAARKTSEYEEARQWKRRWQKTCRDDKTYNKKRFAAGIISESEVGIPQEETSERILNFLQKGGGEASAFLDLYSVDPSPFVRMAVAEAADHLDNASVMIKLTQDEEPEIRSYARRSLVTHEVKGLQGLNADQSLSFYTSDLFSGVKEKSGERFFIIKNADREKLRDEFSLGEEDLQNLHLPFHVRRNEEVDILWWGLIDIRFLRGKKVWLLEEFQSDILQKTKNKFLRERFFEKCESCQGKGTLQKSKREQYACSSCYGAGGLPVYPRELMKDILIMAKKAGIKSILIPTAEDMIKKYAGMLKPSKAGVLYNTIPQQMGFKLETLDEEILFGEEDGGPVRSKKFFAFNLA